MRKREYVWQGNAQLPNTGMLMFDTISKISSSGGEYDKGYIDASLEIKPDLWFFDCHFINDPVMPGCLGLDAMWQLVGFYLGWSQYPGKGRALGVGEVRFTGQILPTAKKVTYKINIKRLITRKLIMGIGEYCVCRWQRNIYSKRLKSWSIYLYRRLLMSKRKAAMSKFDRLQVRRY